MKSWVKILTAISSIMTGLIHIGSILVSKKFSWTPFNTALKFIYHDISIVFCCILVLVVPILVFKKEKLGVILGFISCFILLPWIWTFVSYMIGTFFEGGLIDWFKKGHLFFGFILMSNLYILWVFTSESIKMFKTKKLNTRKL